ncbi:MAG TPA: PilT/PilU family type 4a pilus ATPase [Solirubrobacteraceae bacterium]|nr:PilT/PilU family type 4a pilus ATPase [Solirubrobacteraceae bacterium]
MSATAPNKRHDLIGRLLRALIDAGGSDLCVKVGSRPVLRVHGKLRWVEGAADALAAQDTREILEAVLPEERREEFAAHHEADFAYSLPDLGTRFRVNAYVQRGCVSLVFRLVPEQIRSLAELGLPDIVRELAEEERGIVLVTGTTGSGKSTTLAAIIEHINNTAFRHVVTIEDPIEFVYRDKRSVIDQREIGSDTGSFDAALRRVLRQDPDVILIGEMRDELTVRTALAAAETGHLVLSTLHTLDAPESINRILDFFAPEQHLQARAMLAATLKGIISQRLVPRADGEGRVAICEVLTMTGRVHDLIRNPERDGSLAQIVAQGEYYGMQSFDQALYAALVDGAITLDDALRYASQPHDLQLRVTTYSSAA